MDHLDKREDADRKRYQEGLQQLLWGVARGDVEWLQIAVRLRAASDAEAIEQMELAVGEALERQPTNVLKIAVPGFDLEAVCGGPDVDDARYDSFELSMEAIDRRMAKVAEITETSLVAIRDACLKKLEDSRKGIADFYGKAR